jgi:hypothetical protein
MVLFAKIMIGVSILIFLVGLIKPKWVLFWMKEPDRLTTSTIGLFLFMASVTGFSELTMKHKTPEQREREHRQERSADDQNELQLDRR